MIQFDKIKGILCDMDGVIYHGSKILPGVPEFIEWLKENKKEIIKKEIKTDIISLRKLFKERNL